MELLKIKTFIKRLFPERQLFYRSQGRVRFISFAPGVQIVCFVALLSWGSWTGYREFTTVTDAERIAMQEDQIEQLSSESSSLKTQNEGLTHQVGQLQSYLQDSLSRLAETKASHEELVARVQEHTGSDLQRMGRAVALTGLKLDQLLPTLGKPDNNKGMGGPMVAPQETDQNRAPYTGLGSLPAMPQADMKNLDKQLSAWSQLRSVLNRLPLAAPVGTGRVSSGFGARSDPFTHGSAVHYGLDISAAKGTPIYATAPGVVTFAGLNGPYGNMVEIDHGLGIKTRHGHLSKILVKAGDKVSYRDKIALMGSTGRSTGPHLHYEVVFHGVPQNPAKFLKAGKYVLEEG
ncbi:MAG: M23 family metallopeptidase [Gammaproteobacteria bacterium]|nr:M23 family metallopeptidase [Gammaproteobacteria bacterium]